MSVGSHSSHKQVDTASRLDSFLIIITFLNQVGRVSIQDMHILTLYINM